MKNKQLAVNFMANLVAFIISAVLVFLLTPYIVAKVGSETYGFVPLANNMSNYVAIFTAALNSMAARFISIEINSHNEKQANIYFNSVLRANSIIALLLILPSILSVVYIDRIFNVPGEILIDVQLTFLFVFINIIIALVGNVFSVATFTKNRLELTSYRNIEANLIKLVTTLLLFFLFVPRIYFITLSSIAVTLYTISTNLYYTKKLMPEIKISLKEYSGKAIKTLVSSGLWNSVNQLSSVMLMSLDIAIANIFIGSVVSGQYALAKTIPSFVLMFISSVVYVFVPQFTILYAQKKRTELLNNINLAIKIVGLVVIIPTSFLIVFGDVFYKLWLPGEDAGFLFLLSNLTLIPMVISGSIHPIFDVFTVTNKLKVPAIVLLITGILNTVVIFLLLKITHLGIISIPIVSLIIGLARNLIFTPIYAAKCLSVRWRSFYLPIFKGVICAGVTILISFAYKILLPAGTWPLLIAAAVVCCTATLAINIFVIFNKNEIHEVMGMIKTKLKK